MSREWGVTDPVPARADALEHALDRVGDRWSLRVVDALLEGPRRFGELAAALPGIASNVLTQRLRHLEHEGIVVAEPYSLRPPRFSYELSAAGRELAGALQLLAHWGAGHGGLAVPLRHRVCGSPVEHHLYCPVCERLLGDDEAGDEEDGDYL